MPKLNVSELDYAVFWCDGSDCRDAHGKDVHRALRHGVRDAGLKGRVKFIKTHCTGQCKSAPITVVCAARNMGAGTVWYCKLKVDDADSIVEEHLKSHCPIIAKTLGSHKD